MIKSSIIIPVHSRFELLERAIHSILDSPGSNDCEIIIVDDCSPNNFSSNYLRPFDSVIKLEQRSGAAVARNKGISKAKGELIYLMDSDDIILERNFTEDYMMYANTNKLFFSEISSQSFVSSYPENIDCNSFFSYVLLQQPFICQTSSLYFPASLNLRFDESLPKHQDWDLVLFTMISRGLSVEKGAGRIFFDRSDKHSLSRTFAYEKSLPWLQKLEHSNIASLDLEQFKFHILGMYKEQITLLALCRQSLFLLLNKRTSIINIAKVFIKRILRFINE